MLFGRISALFFPVSSVSQQFLPLFLGIRDPSYISEGESTPDQSLPTPAPVRRPLQRRSSECPPGASHLHSSLPLSALPAPADAADVLLHARNDARLGSAVRCGGRSQCGIPMEAGQQISCDSDLLLLQDLCRAAPLPPLLPEHTGIPFNSLFLPVAKHSLPPSSGHSANCIPLPLHRGHDFPFDKDSSVSYALCRNAVTNTPPHPILNPSHTYTHHPHPTLPDAHL